MTVEQIMAEIEAKAEAKKVERQIAMLQTPKGAVKHLRAKDAKKLKAIANSLSEITEKPVFTGFTYNSNVELIVAIAQTLQYMKGTQREQVSETLWDVFDTDTRTEIISAYGRMPYVADPLMIEIDGKAIEVDPEAKVRAKKGIKPNVDDLNVLVNTVALKLGLLAEYKCTSTEANMAWDNAVVKARKAELLDSYKDSLK